MIDPIRTEQVMASESWVVHKDPCNDCCGPWNTFMLGKARQAATDTDPALSLSSDEPAFESTVTIELGGCDPMDTGCQDDYEDLRDQAEVERDDALAERDLRQTELDDAVAALATAIAAEATARADMEASRLLYSAKQLDLLAAQIREETYLRREDASAAAAAVADQDTISGELAAHAYHGFVSAHSSALADVAAAYETIYTAQQQLDEYQRLLDVAEFALACAEHNLSVSDSEDQEMWIVSGFSGVLAQKTDTLQREAWYKLGFDLSVRDSLEGTSHQKPLPAGEVTLRFVWREAFIPDDGSAFTYSDFSEDVIVPAGQQVALTTQQAMAVPSTNGATRVVSAPLPAFVNILMETMGGSAYKAGFPAYIHTGTEAHIYEVETASGDGFSGSQELEFGFPTDDFNAAVEEHPERISQPLPLGYQAEDPRPATQTATERTWSDGMIMTLSSEVLTSTIKTPVDDFVGSAWGTEPPIGLDAAFLSDAHRLLFTGDARYSRQKVRVKLQVFLPETRPFDVTVEVAWVKRTQDWATKEWTSEPESRMVTVPAGDITATEADWTEYDPAEGTLIRLDGIQAVPHPDVFDGVPQVTIAPPA